MFIGVVDEMTTWYIPQDGDWEFKPPERFCHWNHRYLHQRLSSKVSWVSESGNLLLVRSKISHVLAGLDPPGSTASVKAEPRIQQGTLPFELRRCLNQVNGWGNWRYQNSETGKPRFPTHYFLIRTLKKIGKLIDVFPSQKSITDRHTCISTC